MPESRSFWAAMALAIGGVGVIVSPRWAGLFLSCYEITIRLFASCRMAGCFFNLEYLEGTHGFVIKATPRGGGASLHYS